MNMRFSHGAAMAACLALAAVAGQVRAADEWGAVQGQIKFKGEVPPPTVATATKDQQVCGNTVPTDELVVDPSTKGIANVFVWVAKAPSKIKPDLKQPKDPVLKFDQKMCRFTPHTLVVRVGQQVDVVSSDPVAHNTHTNPFRNQPANFILAPNDQVGVKVPLKVAERLPVKINCDIHPWMIAWWLVIDHPYGTVTDAQGNFKIEGLPPGKHNLTIWQEKAGYLDKTFSITVEPGKTVELKPLEYDAAKFKK